MRAEYNGFRRYHYYDSPLPVRSIVSRDNSIKNSLTCVTNDRRLYGRQVSYQNTHVLKLYKTLFCTVFPVATVIQNNYEFIFIYDLKT